MHTTIDVPDELLALLKQSRLGSRPLTEQVRFALAVQLLQEGLVSVGKAAELAGEPLVGFEQILVELGVPVVWYDTADYEADVEAFAEAKRRSTPR